MLILMVLFVLSYVVLMGVSALPQTEVIMEGMSLTGYQKVIYGPPILMAIGLFIAGMVVIMLMVLPFLAVSYVLGRFVN